MFFSFESNHEKCYLLFKMSLEIFKKSKIKWSGMDMPALFSLAESFKVSHT